MSEGDAVQGNVETTSPRPPKKHKKKIGVRIVLVDSERPDGPVTYSCKSHGLSGLSDSGMFARPLVDVDVGTMP